MQVGSQLSQHDNYSKTFCLPPNTLNWRFVVRRRVTRDAVSRQLSDISVDPLPTQPTTIKPAADTLRIQNNMNQQPLSAFVFAFVCINAAKHTTAVASLFTVVNPKPVLFQTDPIAVTTKVSTTSLQQFPAALKLCLNSDATVRTGRSVTFAAIGPTSSHTSTAAAVGPTSSCPRTAAAEVSSSEALFKERLDSADWPQCDLCCSRPDKLTHKYRCCYRPDKFVPTYRCCKRPDKIVP
jgi:hypothetical protein